eukprot:1160922-Pelagomonas_calceolata.AAC.2
MVQLANCACSSALRTCSSWGRLSLGWLNEIEEGKVEMGQHAAQELCRRDPFGGTLVQELRTMQSRVWSTKCSYC